MNKNYYEILGVSQTSSIREIKERYKKLQSKYDPKINPNKKESKKWKDIKVAYQMLSKKETKSSYDISLVSSKESNLEVEIVNKEECNNHIENIEVKAYFLPRMLAYMIDMLIISFVASFVFQMFPQASNLVKLNDQYFQLQQEFVEQKVTSEQYVAQSFDLSYDMAYQNVIYVIIIVALGVSYFVIFQYKRNGQTLGKQIFKIRTVPFDANKKLTMNSYLYRGLILQAIALNIISIIGVLTISKNGYGSFSFGLNVVQSLIIFISVLMVLFRKDGRGIHDIISGTRVVMDGSKEKVLCEN